jgi:transposase
VKRNDKQMLDAEEKISRDPLAEQPPLNGQPRAPQQRPDPEVVPSRRRTHSVPFKIKVVETVARLRKEGTPGAIGAYLRQEGLYGSSVTNWERSMRNGTLTTSRPGPKGKKHSDLQDEVKRLRRKLEQTEKKLAKTQLLVEIQKKLSAILDEETEERSPDSARK